MGVLYDDSYINDALDGVRTIRSTQSGLGDPSHGTAVTGIAAGNGAMRSCTGSNCCRGSGVFVGIAPQADIIAVKLRDILDIPRALVALAADTALTSVPMVVNISVVTQDGPHDGTGDIEKAIDTPSDQTFVYGFAAPLVPDETCLRSTDDTDGDGLRGCADPDCWWRCAPSCPPFTSCPASAPRCGDGVCDPSFEDRHLCPADCP